MNLTKLISLKILGGLALSLLLFTSCGSNKTTTVPIGLGWSNNSVNTVVFRNSALTTYKKYQFTAYYNPEGKLVLAKRKLQSKEWEVYTTKYSGNVKDAHNTISIAVDASGYLHVSWDHHNTKLRYAKSVTPLGLQLTEELSMTGLQEMSVTYPEFHNLPNGKLLFCYRSGESGRGNMVINEYDVVDEVWKQLQDNLLNGEEQRSAYWQMAIGEDGAIHLSWVWRETWDVSTNHDMCYAVSYDGGKHWQNSKGESYHLPITKSTAEIAWQIPQNSSLINQTSMTVDTQGNPYIATYWETDGVPQYKIVYRRNSDWKLLDTDFHKEPFYLGGGGTKSIPIARPKIGVDDTNIYLLFRDEEKGNKIQLAHTPQDTTNWEIVEISKNGVGQWEPNYDEELWKTKRELHVFSQKVIQVDGEGLTEIAPQPVEVIEVKL
ncbi:BNR repeat-containing protein [Neptunitalea lumnitzerae]|uniref:Neuraminidase n=1 Tax=Neptunitalea lumnitzerae TaxID=2965509 RepID=A0ABQ5MM30_9FLAO|nr:BNR repeat-containing protein [Neptunitalea sp. Y10]GLB50366.1 hypothetical protein Y10_27340 [Neptunitalea sp. Y10]